VKRRAAWGTRQQAGCLDCGFRLLAGDTHCIYRRVDGIWRHLVLCGSCYQSLPQVRTVNHQPTYIMDAKGGRPSSMSSTAVDETALYTLYPDGTIGTPMSAD